MAENILLKRRELERQALGLGIPGKKGGETDEMFNKRVDAAQKQRDADIAERNARWDDNMFASKLGVYNPQTRNYLIQQRQMRQDNANRMGIMRENNAMTERIAQGENDTKRAIADKQYDTGLKIAQEEGAIKREVANLNNQNQLKIARLNNQNQLGIAKINTASAEQIARGNNAVALKNSDLASEEAAKDRELKQDELRIKQAQTQLQQEAVKMAQEEKDEKEKLRKENAYEKGLTNALKGVDFRGYDKIKGDVSTFVDAMDAAKDGDGSFDKGKVKRMIENNGYGRTWRSRDTEVNDLIALYNDIAGLREEQRTKAGLGL